MLKKMRWRFILASMTAFTVVMTLLVVGINLITYFRNTASQREMLTEIAGYRSMVQENPEETHLPISQMPWAPNPGGEFTARFFAIECSAEGEMNIFDREYISSVDEDTARSYATAILEKGKSAGVYRDYRYLVQETGSGLTLTFLNIADAGLTQKNLLLTSLVIWAGSLLVVFGLVLLFSKKAIRPFVKNMEQQKRFITDAGHELKTPITSIRTSADILSAELEDSEWLENIQAQSSRLTTLVNNLVLLSRLGEDTPFPEMTEFSLSEVVWETAENFRARMKAEGKKYTQSVAEDVTMHGDREAIQKMVSILLDNAIRYSGAEGEINLKLHKSAKKILLEIENSCDTSRISDPERLFERFYRPDASRASGTGGSGIGLSIAKSIAENHRGTICVKLPDSGHIKFQIQL